MRTRLATSIRAEEPSMNARRETAWPDCGQPECGSPSFASLVWPGQGRKHFCVRHWSQVLGVCDAMGMDPNTCDPRRTAEDVIGEATRDAERS